jgi:putative transposase
MQLTAQLQLIPTSAQAASLASLMSVFNKACHYISDQAWQSRTFRRFDLHKLCYRSVRLGFGLSAQAAVRATDPYKLDSKTKRTFRAAGAVCFDNRIPSYSDASVSIWSPLAGCVSGSPAETARAMC